MADVDHPRLRELFDAIVELPDGDRSAKLEALTGDAALRARVLDLVRRSEVPVSRATKVQRQLSGVLEDLAGPEVGVGDVLGAWQLASEIGRGGMGAVFLAKRVDGHFDQSAAIKVLQGRPSPAALELLASERQILAKLVHPNIARLLDGGATPKGRPYLVMEHIEGRPLDEYFAPERPALRDRLRLFLAICDAVAFAHARLVVHCDLKPSNVLVDAKARPVLLDFGIAKLIDAEGERKRDHKAYTPGYASPELQAGGTVGTATDVYSLGVMLRELAATDDADVAAIVRRATQADPAARYDSVIRLAQDVERFLGDRPVLARDGGWAYRTRKLLRRRWLAALVATLFVATTLAFTWRVTQEREAANREAAAANASNAFLQSVFQGADLEKGGSRDTTALELVDRGRERIDEELSGQPATQATMHETLAQAYASLGDEAKAREGFERAIAIERTVTPARPLDLANMLWNIAVLDAKTDKPANGEAAAREAMALAEANAAPDSREVGNAATALGLVLSGMRRSAEAEPLFLRHLEIRKKLGDPPDDLASTWHNLGLNARNAGENAKAIGYFREAVAAKKLALGDRHIRTLNSMGALATSLAMAGQVDEAIEIETRVVAVRREVQGEHSMDAIGAAGELANMRGDAGDYVGCVESLDWVLAQFAAIDQGKSPTAGRMLNNQSWCLRMMGDMERAVDTSRRSLAIRQATLPAGDVAIARTQVNLARLLMLDGKLDEALPLLRDADAVRSEKLPEGNGERIESRIALTDWERRAGKLDQARASMQAWSAQADAAGGGTQSEGRRVRAWIAAAGDDRDSALATMRELVDAKRTASGADRPDTLLVELELLELRAAAGDRDTLAADADALRVRAAALPKSFPPESRVFVRLRSLQ